MHHYFGYIGHVGNTPFNGDDKFLVALRVPFQDRLPEAGEPADVVLLDAENGFAVEKIEETRAWNPQQGTMFYWNPAAPERELFFNDRDQETNKIFVVLYDIEKRERVREYRFEDTPVGNGGVSQSGGYFWGINYGRMARLRPVTGYPGAFDWNPDTPQPEDDGVFKVDIETGERELMVSFAQMAAMVKENHPQVEGAPLFINHTLSNREGDRVFFFVRGNFNNRDLRVNVPVTMNADGSGLVEQKVFIGGHPEWEFGSRMMGTTGDELVLYDTATQEIVSPLGTPEIFLDPEGDLALSPDGTWLISGGTDESEVRYTVFRRGETSPDGDGMREMGEWAQSEVFLRTGYEHGPLRLDPAPCWNRAGNAVVFPAFAEDGTRQMFLMRVIAE